MLCAHTHVPARENDLCNQIESIRLPCRHFRSISFPLHRNGVGSLFLDANARGLGAVVFNQFVEPFVFQRLPRRDALFGVVDENLAQQVEEEFVEVVRGRNGFLETLHAAHKFAGAAWSVG